MSSKHQRSRERRILLLREITDLPCSERTLAPACCACRCRCCAVVGNGAAQTLCRMTSTAAPNFPHAKPKSVFDYFYEQLYCEKRENRITQCNPCIETRNCGSGVDTKPCIAEDLAVPSNPSQKTALTKPSPGNGGHLDSRSSHHQTRRKNAKPMVRDVFSFQAENMQNSKQTGYQRSICGHDKSVCNFGLPLGCFQIYLARETHQLAEANQEKNARLKEAFGLSDYVEGSAFDPERKAKEEAAKAAALAQKKYTMVHSSDEEAGKDDVSPPHKKKKKKSRHSSTSPDRSKEKRKKSRKHSKRDRSHSKKHRKSKHRSKKRSSEKKKHKRHYSTSSSGSDSHVDSEDSDVPNTAKDKPEAPQSKANGHGQSPVQIAPVQRKEPSPPVPSPPKQPSVKSLPLPQKPLQISSQIDNNSNKFVTEKLVAKISGNGRESSSRSRSRSRSASHQSLSKRRSTRKLSSGSSSSRSRSRSDSRSRSRSRGRSSHRYSNSKSKSRSRSRDRSRSASSRSDHRSSHRDSRSPSIRRRHGSPSHLDKRRITRSRSPARRSHKYRYSRSYSRSRSRSRSWSPSMTRRYNRRRHL